MKLVCDMTYCALWPRTSRLALYDYYCPNRAPSPLHANNNPIGLGVYGFLHMYSRLAYDRGS